MSPAIEIDDEVLDELKEHAEPFVDTPNTVLRRLLGLEPADEGEVDAQTQAPTVLSVATARSTTGKSRKRRTRKPRAPRAKTGSILTESAYELPILQIISEHNGRAAAREVIDDLGKRLADQLTEADYEELASGDVRWRNRAQFVRLRLVERGDMVKDSPRGIWEISEQGRRRIADAA